MGGGSTRGVSAYWDGICLQGWSANWGRVSAYWGGGVRVLGGGGLWVETNRCKNITPRPLQLVIIFFSQVCRIREMKLYFDTSIKHPNCIILVYKNCIFCLDHPVGEDLGKIR